MSTLDGSGDCNCHGLLHGARHEARYLASERTIGAEQGFWLPV
jgi:hypothetical protein